MTTTLSEIAKYVADQVSYKDNLVEVMNVVMPGLYDMGFWKDLTFEERVYAQTGQSHVALPHYAESLICGMIDGFPVGTKAQWADYKIRGMLADGPPALFGLVDDGLHPTMADLPAGDGFNLTVEPADHNTTLPSEGEIIVNYTDNADPGVMKQLTLALDGTASMSTALTSTDTISAITRIQFEGVPEYVSITADDGADVQLALATNRGSLISRYRWYRFSSALYSNPTIILFMKRSFEKFLREDDIVWLSDPNAIRYAVLAHYYENQADIERATSYSALAERSLSRQLDQYRAAAKPDIDFRPAGKHVSPVQNAY